MVPSSSRMNYDDYARLPDDGKRYEIIDGELRNAPAPLPRHQRVLGNLNLLLRLHVEKEALGEIYFAPIDVLLSYEDVVQPDIIYVRSERADIIGEKNVQGTPDLVVEVVSEGRKAYDRETKRKLYEKYGVSEYWLVDPKERAVEVYRLTEGKYGPPEVFQGDRAVESPLFPGLVILLADIFR